MLRSRRAKTDQRRDVVLTCRVGWNNSGCPTETRQALHRHDFDYRRVRFRPRTVTFRGQSRYIVRERIRVRTMTIRIVTRGSRGITSVRAIRLGRRCFSRQRFPGIIIARFLSISVTLYPDGTLWQERSSPYGKYCI